MKATSEFIKFDDEDRGNIDYEGGEYPYGIHKAEKDHMFFLCYYTPLKGVLLVHFKLYIYQLWVFCMYKMLYPSNKKEKIIRLRFFSMV